MDSQTDDPLLRSSRREALVTIIVFVIAISYTVGYCTLHGYKTSEEELQLVWGIPDWIMWGVLLPWGVCTLFHCWFSTFIMQDHPLEEASLPPDAEGMTGE